MMIVTILLFVSSLLLCNLVSSLLSRQFYLFGSLVNAVLNAPYTPFNADFSLNTEVRELRKSCKESSFIPIFAPKVVAALAQDAFDSGVNVVHSYTDFIK